MFRCFENLMSKFFVVANVIDTNINYQLVKHQYYETTNLTNLCDL